MQRGKDLKFHPIFYFSKRSTEVESRYHSFELEMLAIVYAVRRFRVYLLGIPFKIVTDCNSLTLALKKKEINPRISRWVMKLQGYDYTAEHREGKRMSHVDGLSKRSWIGIVNDNSFETNLVIAQNKDKMIADLKQKIEIRQDKHFELRNGVLYRKGENTDTLLFYVPEFMEKNVLFKYHDELAHQGVTKVYETLRKSYWFPDMKNKINEHIRNCCKCIAFTPSSAKSRVKLM